MRRNPGELRGRGLSDSYIGRILSDLRAGIRRAWKRQEIDRPVFVMNPAQAMRDPATGEVVLRCRPSLLKTATRSAVKLRH